MTSMDAEGVAMKCCDLCGECGDDVREYPGLTEILNRHKIYGVERVCDSCLEILHHNNLFYRSFGPEAAHLHQSQKGGRND